MKIKCLRFECEVCSKLASIQVFYNKSGTIKYGRARHYTGQLNCKPQFQYHQQSLEYIQIKLCEMPMDKAEIGHIGQNGQEVNVDLKKPELRSKLSTVEGGEGFDPAPCWRFHPKLLFFLGVLFFLDFLPCPPRWPASSKLTLPLTLYVF